MKHLNPLEPAPHAGRYGRGRERDEEAIREDVERRRTAHSLLDGSDVRVEVREHEVTLRGTVTSEGGRTLARDIAEGVSVRIARAAGIGPTPGPALHHGRRRETSRRA